MSNNARRIKAILTVSVAVMVILITATALVYVLCRADTFEIIGAELYSDEEILNASEIKVGAFLYSVDKETAKRNILSKCTFLNEVQINVKLPNRVIITVTEDVPLFYVDVGVSTVMFGYDLRIAEVRQNSDVGSGVQVIMPEITSAVAGSRITFKNGEPTYIAKLLEAAVKSDLFDRITLINCESTRTAFFEVDGKYKLILGGLSELDIKLRVAKEYLQNPRIADAASATLDLTSAKEVIVTINE